MPKSNELYAMSTLNIFVKYEVFTLLTWLEALDDSNSNQHVFTKQVVKSKFKQTMVLISCYYS